MTAQPIDPDVSGMWGPDPLRQRLANYTIEDVLNPVHVNAYDLVDGRYELVADSAEELIVTKPFDVRLPVRDIAP
ncbi:hypothetical protein [Micromonospora sediminimaris]|uniref:Uncharacterized protein n=1 Tax=Micromonospora sediminimaris TaxID=547162 RepID=A0A9W5XIK7_9ACTN|nr:hypothetical protein [Micromonospora sediminimaris]GIJ32360.1 hypothetical protein Vse01_15080 [Micromonospora sediminimaris]SFD33488.1 hypothetical protein SAMN05216284_11547 [Micromonospora sediminimaris]